MLTREELDFIKTHKTSGYLKDGTPWVAVDNMPDRDFSAEEIIEALQTIAHEQAKTKTD